MADLLSAQNAADAAAAAMQRADRQTILYRFTDRLFRANSLAAVYSAALDAIMAGLSCSRSSILCFDEAGRMKFVAWHGLSDDYRAAVEGHSPWTPDTRDAGPLCVPDISWSDQPQSIKDTVLSEGIVGLCFIPLIVGGRVIGKFMAYYDKPHEFTPVELELAVTIARQLGFSIARTRAEEARRTAEERLRTNEERLRLIQHVGGIGSFDWDIEGGVVYRSPEHLILQGLPPDTPLVVPYTGEWLDRVYPDDRNKVVGWIREAVEAGGFFDREYRIVRPDNGQVRWLQNRGRVEMDENGRPVRVLSVQFDITERKAAEVQRQILVSELNHRVKNTLATVQSLALQTLRGTDRSVDARKLLDSRLAALSRAHDVLTAENWGGARLHDVIEEAIEPFLFGDDRFEIVGPDVYLSPQQALALSIGLHELGTNASKYGSLKARGGRVDITWFVVATADGLDELQLTWRESGGPVVSPPTRFGFGSRLIKSLARELGSYARIDYRPEGVVATIRSPLTGPASPIVADDPFLPRPLHAFEPQNPVTA